MLLGYAMFGLWELWVEQTMTVEEGVQFRKSFDGRSLTTFAPSTCGNWFPFFINGNHILSIPYMPESTFLFAFLNSRILVMLSWNLNSMLGNIAKCLFLVYSGHHGSIFCAFVVELKKPL
ncbi:hypothetical protein FRX31_030043 [Thalictrum thalictroides]|uniref:Uncharacterized protein n=1 Tax=Thalictrum thalictroides TaxID=46969 RepID=A0A7J6V6X5_THATH|nr:hypothetical protein FRX31_030043 [Thalictrum thalictroides]